jgi:hypothetical protein
VIADAACSLLFCQAINERMDTVATNLARTIESRKKCRVVHMVCEFVTDPSLSRVWLRRTAECLTAIDGKKTTPKLTDHEQRLMRSTSAPQIGQVLTNGMQPAAVFSTSTRVPGHVEERLQKRREREDDSVDELAVQRVLDELELEQQQQQQQQQSSSVASSLTKRKPRRPVPSEPLEDRRSNTKDLARSEAAAKALGSSQLSGCPGDFCGP